ncbi:hypothetical protein ABIB26_003702 [Arthrobacter sp. UYEF20]
MPFPPHHHPAVLVRGACSVRQAGIAREVMNAGVSYGCTDSAASTTAPKVGVAPGSGVKRPVPSRLNEQCE